MHERWRTALIDRWARLVSHWPRSVLAVSLLLAGAAIWLTASQVQFQTDRNDLIASDIPWNQRFIAWRDIFASKSNLYVVIDTHDAQGQPSAEAAERARRAVAELGPRLAELERVEHAFWGFTQNQVHPRALRIQPTPAYEAAMQQMLASEPVLASPSPEALLEQAIQSGEPAEASPEQLSGLIALLERFTLRMQTDAGEPVELLGALIEPELGGWQPLMTENGRFLLIQLEPRAKPTALSPYAPAIAAIRDVLEQARQAHPGLELGLTGTEAVETDETAAAVADSTRASILAVVLITVLLIAAFASVRTPMLLVAALLIGVAWSFGFLTLAVGHLQVISVVFAVILLGLGVAYGIHLVARYETVRHAHPNDEAGFAAAMRQTMHGVGPGILTGAITTAVAFCATLLTDFRGVAEMGAIAAGGILLCLVAMCSVLPALLRLFKHRHEQVRPVEQRRVTLFSPRWVMPMARRPRLTVAVAAVLLLPSVVLAAQLRFDYNLVSLMPEGMESVEWQQRIAANSERSIWSGVSVVQSLDEARELAQRYRALPQVQAVGGVAMLMPADEQAKLDRARQVREQLDDALGHAIASQRAQPEQPGRLIERLRAVRLAIHWSGGRAEGPWAEAMEQLDQAIGDFLAAADRLEPAQREQRLAALQRDYHRDRIELARLVNAALDPNSLQPEDLPAELTESYVGHDGDQRLYVVEAYPRLPEGVHDPLQPAFLGGFVERLQEVDPAVTGTMVQLYKSGQLIWRSYLQAGVYALLAVFVLVWLDFRSMRDALLTLVPVAAGFSITFALMWLSGASINPANIIVLPLMFGIGVDAGIHMLHRYRQQPHARPLGLASGTGKAITVTTLTTMIGFGMLLISQHRGIASLGFVLSTGLAMTLLACWLVMPALLELCGRDRRPDDSQASLEPGQAEPADEPGAVPQHVERV